MRTRQSELDLTVTQRGFKTMTVTIAGLYLATQSVTVTIVGTAAASVLTCWALWLAQQRRRTEASQKSQRPRHT
jgi:membrane protein implicated in regulation of membrane protease activity